jgi:hypothetical protein
VLANAMVLAAERAGPLAARHAARGIDDVTRTAGFAYDVQGAVSRRNPHLGDAARAMEGELRTLLGALDDSDDAARPLFERARALRAGRR